MSLAAEKCTPCVNGKGKLSDAEVAQLLGTLKGWKVDDVVISKRYTFKDFLSALDFVNRLGTVAEEEGHHPDLKLGWGYVEVAMTTHDAGGLTRNDFIVAAKVDGLM